MSNSSSVFLKIIDDSEVDIIEFITALIELDPEAFFDESSDEHSSKKCRISRNRCKDLWTSGWGRMLLDPSLKIADSYIARVFRRRFRVPYPLFVSLVEEINELNLFDERYYSRIATEFKVLCCLRILGRDTVADDVVEFLGIGETTVLNIFRKFVFGMKDLLYQKYIKPPQGEHLRKVKSMYER